MTIDFTGLGRQRHATYLFDCSERAKEAYANGKA